MAFETGTATSMANLVSSLFTFAVANGWTQDQLDTGAGKAALHKDDIYVSFRWNTSTPDSLAIYQALGYSGGSDPGNHTDDSGSSLVSDVASQLEASRGAYQIGNGPYTSYEFFHDTNPDHIYVALQYASGDYTHFGFGELEKQGDWTGGEFCYGEIWDSPTPTSTGSSVLLDGLWSSPTTFNNNRFRAATIHMEGFLTQDGSSKWGAYWASTSSTGFEDDRAGNPREKILGGFRGGPIAAGLGFVKSGPNGFVPLYRIGSWWFDETTNPTELSFLGFMPNVAGVNIAAFNPRQEVTIGSDTWIMYPSARKQNTGSGRESKNQGIAYRKVV